MNDQKTSPLKAVRQKCLECSCGNQAEVRQCVIERCPLYPFRFGKNPFRQKRELSEEARAAAAARLHAGRARRAQEERKPQDKEL